MDISLFMHLQNYENAPSVDDVQIQARPAHISAQQSDQDYISVSHPLNKTAHVFKHHSIKDKVEVFGVFKPLSVKLIMIDHMTHYVHDVLARFLEDTLHFTSIFPWVTANLVSFTGLTMAIIASRLIISNNVNYMRLGALLFEMRNLADSLDGVVFRSHERRSLINEVKLAESFAANSNEVTPSAPKLIYQSHYGSAGYNVDAVCDGLGGLFFVVAILIKFLRHLPHKCKYFYSFFDLFLLK
jgi:hypothetical protein